MIVAMLLSGSIGLVVLASGQSPMTVVFFRCVIGALTLLGYLFWQGQWKPLSRPSLMWLLTGAAALIANWLLLFSAYAYSGVGITTVVYHVQPFFLLLLTALIQKEIPS